MNLLLMFYLVVICVIYGLCIGLGVDIVCCVDICFVVFFFVFFVKEVEIGMVVDVGIFVCFFKIVGNYFWVKDVCFIV